MIHCRKKTGSRLRIFSLRLRTILILVTVFCLWCGWYVKRARQQRAAVDWVQSVTGTVSYSSYRHLLPVAPQWLRWKK